MSKSLFRNYSETYFFNTCFDKNQLKNLISWLINQSGEKKTVDFLEILKEIGFHRATLAGVSLGLDDLQIPSQKSFFISQTKTDVSFVEQEYRAGNLTSVEKSQHMISTWNQTSEILRKAAIQQFKNTNQMNPVYMMAFSGARGNISQVRQLVAMRGLMADPQGAIIEFPIQSNFREGLTLTEYLISCFGARKGLVDTSLRTATAGYLTRRLVDAAQHVIVSIKDCGTTQGFRLRNKNLEPHLLGRVLSQDLKIDPNLDLKRNQIISPTLAKIISKKVQEVFVRSPLTCQAENSICQFCYGWNLAHGKLVNLGDAVGVLAAQSIGEPGTQLTMRTFHTGGVGVFSDQAMKFFRAPYDGTIEYIEGLPGHFVRTPHGKIVYMLRTSPNNSNNASTILKLRSEGSKQLEYSIKKQDLPTGSILLVRQGERVKIGQVLAQVPLVKQSKQRLPESSYPIFSPISGEIGEVGIQTRHVISEDGNKNAIQTLNGVRDFWIFSSQNQQEFHNQQKNHCGNTFLRPGDLVSTKTSLFQCNGFISFPSIFTTLENKSSLGLNAVYLPVEKINFHKRTYSIVLKNFLHFKCNQKQIESSETTLSLLTLNKNQKYQKSKKDFLFFAKKRRDFFLLWFPTGSILPTSGYFFVSRNYSDIKPEKFINSSLFTIKDINNLQKSWFQGNLSYISKPIKKSKINLSLNFQNKKIRYILNLHHQQKIKRSLFVECLPNIQYSSYFNFSNSSIPLFENSKEGILKTKNRNWYKKSENKIKFLSCLQKKYIISSRNSHYSDFQKRALSKVKSSLLSTSGNTSFFIQEKKDWIYIPLTTKKNYGSKKIIENTTYHSKITVDLLKKTNVFLQQNNSIRNKNFIFQSKEKSLFSAQNSSFSLQKVTKSGKLIAWEQGKIFNNFVFPYCKIGIDYIPFNEIGFLKSFSKNTPNINQQNKNIINYSLSKNTNFWYSKEFLLTSECYLFKKYEKINSTKLDFSRKISTNNTLKNQFNCYVYYQMETKDSFLQNNNEKFLLGRPHRRINNINIQNQVRYFLSISKIDECFFPKKSDVFRYWNSLKSLNPNFLKKSPLFTKQEVTHFSNEQKQLKNFQLIVSDSMGWFCRKNVYKFLINLNSPLIFKKVNESFFVSKQLKNHKIPLSGFQLFRYDFLVLPKKRFLNFSIFENNWVTPDIKITTDFILLKESGEIRRFKYNDKNTITCILTKQDLRTINLSKFLNTSSSTKNLKNTKVELGKDLRSGMEVLSGIGVSEGGLIITKTLNKFILRSGIPFLTSSGCIYHIMPRDIIQKNDLLLTLKSKTFQTEDIVQGIPKIDQLFEARESQGGIPLQNSAHLRLKKYFVSSLKSKDISTDSWPTALELSVTKSYNKIQFFLVQSIFEAYASQGVNISQKHIEIIVRQMTRRVRIVHGGDSGLLPGELILYTRIQKLNNQLFSLGKRIALYEPILLGITKSVLQSESFLVAASFQQVSRVLVRSALARKTDFLRGLHENIILGQVIPAGTGLITKISPKKLTKKISDNTKINSKKLEN